MSEQKPTKLSRKERNQLALLARLARAARHELAGFVRYETRELALKLRDIEYEVRMHWRLTR